MAKGVAVKKTLGSLVSLPVSRFDRQTLKMLNRMKRENIPVFPVYDSVICRAQHEDFLRQVTVEECQKAMGFEPVIG